MTALSRGRSAAVGCALAVLCLQCKGSSPRAAGGAEAAVEGAREAEQDGGAEPMTERERAAWGEADSGDPAELLRLADLVGCSGLRARAASSGLRALAIQAMRHCPDFGELPWLADLASTGGDDVALLALDSIIDQAARPRRAVDPEDADELHAGCATLLSLARSTDRPRPRRVGAVRALRMLAERGCVQKADIPSDVDAK